MLTKVNISARACGVDAKTKEQIAQLSQDARDRINTAVVSADEDLALLDPQRIRLTQAGFDAVDNPTMDAALRTYAEACDLKYDAIMPKADALRMVDNLSRSASMAVMNELTGYSVETAVMLGGAVAI